MNGLIRRRGGENLRVRRVLAAFRLAARGQYVG